MSASELLAALNERGIEVWAEGEALRFRAPSGALTPELTARLKASKAEVLALLARRAFALPAGALPKVEPKPAERGEPFPLTDIQAAYWLGAGEGFELGGVSAHVYLEHELRDLDLPRLAAAWDHLLERHEMLRAHTLPDGRQRILAAVEPITIAAFDGRALPAAELEAHLETRRERMIRKGPPIDRYPLYELAATLLPGGRTRLHLAISLLIVDAWSFHLLLRDLVRFYLDPELRLPPLELSFRDYVLALGRVRESAAYEAARAFWWERLADLPPPPELPLAASPAALAAPRFTRRRGELDAEAFRRLKALAAAHGATPTAAVCAAYASVLAAWAKSPRFLLNVLFFQRLPLHREVPEIVGNFSSTLLLAVDSSPAKTFGERALELQEGLWAAIEHSQISGVELLRELSRRDGGSGRRSAPVVFASALNLGGGDAAAGEESGWRVIESRLQTPQVWLDHQVSERGGALVLNWDALEDLFPPGLLDAMFGAYLDLLRRLASGALPFGSARLELLPAADRALIQAANATAAPLPGGLLQSGFLARAAQHPERPAVFTAHRTCSYGELRTAADFLAAHLRARGARAGELVAVVMEKGWEQVVGVLAALQAGAAYLPLDPGLPAERLRLLLAQSEVRLVLTQPALLDALAWPAFVELHAVEPAQLTLPGVPTLALTGKPEDLAYVIFTSGSTGTPKGVMIDHRGALNTVADINARFGVGEGDRVLALSALNFDLSVYDLFGLLAAGGAVVLPEPQELREPARWHAWLARAGVTIWNSVPALAVMLADFLAARGLSLPPALRLVLLSGDWIPVTLPDRLRALGAVEVVSLGGATEASIWSISFPIAAVAPEWVSIPYGKALLNQTFYALGEDLEPRPVWVPGELYIGGAGVALGYWRDPERSAERFLTHPESGERLYKTGDLGRLLPDGNLEFLGREDFQVKVQGYRIELGEIESALVQHPAVSGAAVVAVGEARGGKRLVGYAVLEAGAAAEPAELTAFLAAKLPAYMVPPHLEILSELPLTANGKVDRGALLLPHAGGAAHPEQVVPPRTAEERELAALWTELLELDEVGVNQSFFDLGGHSLLAVRLMAELEKRSGRSLPLATLFEAPTIERLAERLCAGGGDGASEVLVAIQPGGALAPFFCVHPVGGNVLCYRELARALGPEQPFFGLAARPRPAAAEVTLEELAAEYVAALRQRQPQGPYRLGGWSMGGVVAFEMARQLEAAGAGVAALVLIDAARPPGSRVPLPAEEEFRAWFERDLAGLGGAGGALGEAEFAGLFATFRRNFRALLAYDAGAVRARVDLLRTAAPAAEADPTWGWGALALGGVVILTLPGDHYTLVQPPLVRELAAALTACLAPAAVEVA